MDHESALANTAGGSPASRSTNAQKSGANPHPSLELEGCGLQRSSARSGLFCDQPAIGALGSNEGPACGSTIRDLCERTDRGDLPAVEESEAPLGDRGSGLGRSARHHDPRAICGSPNCGDSAFRCWSCHFACLASVASAFSWYAMRQGAMLGGNDETTVGHDLQALPDIVLGFVLVVPRLILKRRT